MLCVEDCVDALLWIESIGGLEGAIKRSKKNLEEVKFFVNSRPTWTLLTPKNSPFTSLTGASQRLG